MRVLFRSFMMLAFLGFVLVSCRRDVDIPHGPQGEQGVEGEQGVPGEDGLNPYVGEDGNWWIGEENLGVQVEGDTPYIGENGNWWIADTDTEVPAQGPAGEDGLSPHIGENGHWWIGDEDLGSPVRGPAGEDGLVPYIGENGNWWIGDKDTEVSAKGTANVIYSEWTAINAADWEQSTPVVGRLDYPSISAPHINSEILNKGLVVVYLKSFGTVSSYEGTFSNSANGNSLDGNNWLYFGNGYIHLYFINKNDIPIPANFKDIMMDYDIRWIVIPGGIPARTSAPQPDFTDYEAVCAYYGIPK